MGDAAIIVGAGSGQRLGGVEKAFLKLNRIPMICYSIALFHENFDEIIVVVAEESVEKTEKLIKESIKKYAYNSMREIDEQISAFSKGVNINIKLNKPVS